MRALLTYDRSLALIPDSGFGTLCNAVQRNSEVDPNALPPVDRVGVARALIEAGADPNQDVFGNGMNSLHLIVNRDLPMVQMLVEHGAKVNAVIPEDGDTPLSMALSYDNAPVVGYLREQGGKVVTEGQPIHFAVAANDLAKVKHLLDAAPAAVHATDRWNRTPLLLAAMLRYQEMAQYLLDHGAKVNATARHGETPLYYAAANGNVPMVKLLLEHGASPNISTDYPDQPMTPLMATMTLAPYEATADIVRLMQAHGADPNVRGEEGKTPLFKATEDITAASVLLKLGADINARDNNGETPLFWVVRQGGEEHVQFFVEHGADVNAKNTQGQTPLDIATENDRDDLIHYLTAHGAKRGMDVR